MAGRNEMKPCPFCGAHAIFRPDLHRSTIMCSMKDHGCSVGPEITRATFSEAQRGWNFRIGDEN